MLLAEPDAGTTELNPVSWTLAVAELAAFWIDKLETLMVLTFTGDENEIFSTSALRSS